MTQRDDPRVTLNEVLKNLHGSLKWYWQVVMGLAMVKAVDTLYISLFDKICAESEIAVLCFLCAFLPTFIRFYFGDSRYLDEHYIEYRKWRPIDEYLADMCNKVSARRMVLDIALLMVIGIGFVFMARSLPRPRIFYSTFTVLMLFDMVWLSLTLRLSSNQAKTSIMHQERYDAPNFWVKNNFFHLVLMVPCLFWEFYTPKIRVYTFNVSAQELILLALCVSNSIFDFAYTYDYYFPKLDAAHDKRLREVADDANKAPQPTGPAPGGTGG